MPIYNQEAGVFRGTQLIQRNGTIGGGKHVFVPLQGVKNELTFPTFGAPIANPFKGAAKLFAGDLAEFRTDEKGLHPQYFVLKTYEVVESSSTTVKVRRGGFYHIPFVGDVLMVAPEYIGGSGKAVTVTAVTAATATVSGTTYDVWQLTVSSTLNNPAKGTILVEAEEAGTSKAMLVKDINSVVDSDYDMMDKASMTFGTSGDTNFEDARYIVSFALGGLMYTDRMSPLPECVKKLNKSNVNGWFKVEYFGMKEIQNANKLRYMTEKPTNQTIGAVGDIIMVASSTTADNGVYVCSATTSSAYTWTRIAS